MQLATWQRAVKATGKIGSFKDAMAVKSAAPYDHTDTCAWKTLMSFNSPLLLISNPFSSAKLPSKLKTAYRFLMLFPSSLLAGRIIALENTMNSVKKEQKRSQAALNAKESSKI
jgi:hypothetical protein